MCVWVSVSSGSRAPNGSSKETDPCHRSDRWVTTLLVGAIALNHLALRSRISALPPPRCTRVGKNNIPRRRSKFTEL